MMKEGSTPSSQNTVLNIHEEFGRKLCRILGWLSCFAGIRLVPWRQTFAAKSPPIVTSWPILVCDTSLQCWVRDNAKYFGASYAPMQMIPSEAGSESPTARRLYTPVGLTRYLWSCKLKCSCQSWIDATFADAFTRPKIMYGFCKGIDGIGKLRHDNWVKINRDSSIEDLVNKGWFN